MPSNFFASAIIKEAEVMMWERETFRLCLDGNKHRGH